MDCELQPLACELKRIADDLTQPDIDGFIATLLATLIGAAVALAGSFWLERRRARQEDARELSKAKAQSNERYEERLDTLLFKVIESLGERLRDLHTRPAVIWEAPQALYAAIDTARMVGRGDDAETLKQLKLAAGRVAAIEDSEEQHRDTRVVGQIIRSWREGAVDSVKTSERFGGLAIGP